MAFIIKDDGTKIELKPANGKSFTLDEMQKAVGGFIERVPQTAFAGDVWVDEEGRMNDKLLNQKATKLCYPDGVRAGYYLVGDALFTSGEEVE